MIANLFQAVKSSFGRYRGRPLNALFALVSLVITLGSMGYLIYRERARLFEYPWQINPTALLLAIFFYLLTVLCAALIWGDIINRLGAPISWRRHYRYYCLSNLAKRIPGTVWYIASRATLYAQDGVDLKLPPIASAMELALLQISGIIVSLFFSLSILAQYEVPLWAMALVFLGALGLIHPRVMGCFFRKLKVEVRAFRVRDILVWISGYILLWLIGAMILFNVVNIIYPLPLHNFGYVLGSWALVSMLSYLIVLLPSNLGLTELGLSLLLAQIMPSPVAVAAALLSRLLTTFLDVVTAGLWMAIPDAPQPPKPPITQKD